MKICIMRFAGSLLRKKFLQNCCIEYYCFHYLVENLILCQKRYTASIYTAPIYIILYSINIYLLVAPDIQTNTFFIKYNNTVGGRQKNRRSKITWCQEWETEKIIPCRVRKCKKIIWCQGRVTKKIYIIWQSSISWFAYVSISCLYMLTFLGLHVSISWCTCVCITWFIYVGISWFLCKHFLVKTC